MDPSIGKRDINGCAIRSVSTRESSNEAPAEFAPGASATLLLSAHFGHEPVDDDRAGHPFRLRLEISQNTMRQNRVCDCFEIFHSHQITPLQHGVSLRAAN